jgi:hypothetical protein
MEKYQVDEGQPVLMKGLAKKHLSSSEKQDGQAK